MKKYLVGALLGLFVAITTIAMAQPPKPYLKWDQQAANLAEAQALQFHYYLDGATAGAILSGVACTGTASPFQCTAPLPIPTPITAPHTIQLSAFDTLAESGKSANVPLALPATPANGAVQK